MWENPQQKVSLYRLADKLRLIESECASLHARLAKGEGMEETQPAYEHIQRLRRDAEVEEAGRRSPRSSGPSSIAPGRCCL